MNDSEDQACDEETTVEDNTAENSRTIGGWKIQFWVLCGMLLLALVGMGLTQAMEKGAWEYWLFVVVVYAALGLWRSTSKAKHNEQPVKKLISRELSHWGTVLAFLGVIVLLERREIIDRQSASDVALLLLALSCCLAGVHFDWMLLVVGVALAVMLVAMATLEQYSIVLWIIMILAAISAAAFFYLKAKNRDGDSVVEPVE
jgi:hypothetical protein